MEGLAIKFFCLSFLTCSIVPFSLSIRIPDELPSRRIHEEENNKLTHSKSSPLELVKYRLPDSLVPLEYILHIRPILDEDDPNKFTAPGNVEITLQCNEETNKILLHVDELEIHRDTITEAIPPSPRTNLEFDLSTEAYFQVGPPFQKMYTDRKEFTWHKHLNTPLGRDNDENYASLVTHETSGSQISIENIIFEPVNQTMELALSQNLNIGNNYKVWIEFYCHIPPASERMNGLYQSSYLTETGETRIVATTQFSRTRTVRKVFPSFDEPKFKAKFQINIGRKDPYHSLSCMNIQSTEPIDGLEGWVWDHYAPTPVMPITVIAMVVSDFSSETAPLDMYNPSKPVSTWGPPPLMANGAGVYSAETAAKTLRVLEDLFGIEYELPKMDSVGMLDFAAGAMENWGLNIYRSTFMLYLKGITPISTKYSSANVISHELTHQWWGNLVTHSWWNDWWITEGFASYFEYVGSAAVGPTFNHKNRIISDDMQPAMAFDFGPSTVPIHGPNSDLFIENPSTINYSKGAALIRMMEGFLGNETLMDSLRFYLNKRKYTANDQYALFDDMDEYLESSNQDPTNGQSLRGIMDSWTLVTGFPLIRVSRVGGTNRIYISQELFRNSSSSEVRDSLFHVPISYVQGSNPDYDYPNLQPKFWIDKDTTLMSHVIEGLGENEWILINPGSYGYYRVLYDNYFETLLKSQLETDLTQIHPGSRSGILDDYFTMAYEKYIEPKRALEMTRYLGRESDFVPLISVLKHLRKYMTMMSGTVESNLIPFQNYIKSSLQGALNYVGLVQLPDEQEYNTLFRVQILDWLCSVGDEGCQSQALKLVKDWIEMETENPGTTNPIPIDIQGISYCGAIRIGDDAIWEFLQNQYESSQSTVSLNSLACAENEKNLQSLLDMSLTQNSVLYNPVSVCGAISSNSIGRNLVIKFLQGNIKQLIQIIQPSGITGIFSSLTQYISNSEEKLILETLIAENEEELESEIEFLRIQLKKIDSNLQWVEDFGNEMSEWFEDNYA